MRVAGRAFYSFIIYNVALLFCSYWRATAVLNYVLSVDRVLGANNNNLFVMILIYNATIGNGKYSGHQHNNNSGRISC